MKIKKESIMLWILAVFLIFAGIEVESYILEAIAILLIIFGYVLADSENLFGKPKTEKTKGE